MLIAIAVGTTLLTRAIANTSRALELREAEEWFARGMQDLDRGDGEEAVVAFRRAAMKRRGEKQYVLALARALQHTGNPEAAERALAAVRTAQPEDPDINLALATVSGARGDVAAAIRYYHNALYAAWPDRDGPRRVRLALIRFLLANDERPRAVSELIAATTDLPATADAHAEIGRLFAEAGDNRHALEQFRRALDLDAAHLAARMGAGRAAFALGDYQRARSYLRTLNDPEATALATVADLVITRDPLATRLSAAERRRRALANLAHARQRVETCLLAQQPDVATALLREVQGLTANREIGRETDALEAAVHLVFRIAQHADRVCGPPTPLDRALVVIAQRHEVDQP
jgi:tetratricopeptide (TPR) repeat protein